MWQKLVQISFKWHAPNKFMSSAFCVLADDLAVLCSFSFLIASNNDSQLACNARTFKFFKTVWDLSTTQATNGCYWKECSSVIIEIAYLWHFPRLHRQRQICLLWCLPNKLAYEPNQLQAVKLLASTSIILSLIILITLRHTIHNFQLFLRATLEAEKWESFHSL